MTNHPPIDFNTETGTVTVTDDDTTEIANNGPGPDDWNDPQGEEPGNLEEIPLTEEYDAPQVKLQILDLKLLLRAKNLEFSRPLDINLWSASPAIEALVTSIFEVIDDHLSGVSPRYQNNYKTNIKVVILNLLAAYNKHPEMFVRCSMRPVNYKAKSRYNTHGVSKNIITIIKAMKATGLVSELAIGFLDRSSNEGKLTRIRAGRPLVELFQKHLGLNPAELEIERHHEEVVLKLPKADQRKGQSKYMEYEDDTATNTMRSVVQHINSRLQDHDICLGPNEAELELLATIFKEHNPTFNDMEDHEIPYFNTANGKLHRVFNEGSFELGGRFYGHWVQSIPARIYPFRCRLFIDNEPVVELDYSNLHPHMLYSQEEKPVPAGDLYTLEGVGSEKRPVVKKLFNAMLNASRIDSGVKAIRREPPEGFAGITTTELKTLSEKILAKHDPICHHFGTGIGLKLQYKDSCIAEGIMLDLDKKDIVCIPIHDSFIVQAKHEETLRETMAENYRRVMKGEPPEVDKKEIKRKHRELLNPDLI